MFNRLRFRRRRRGVAATELAVCLPPLLLLVIASIEFTNMIFLNHSCSIAAYEAARYAVAKQSANPAVVTQCNAILDSRGVVATTVVFSPADITTADAGDPVTVTVEADCGANAGILPLWFFHNHKVTSSVTMVREDT